MLTYLFEYLEKQYQLPGASLFQFSTFRAAMAILFSLIIATAFGKRIILFLQKKQVGETHPFNFYHVVDGSHWFYR